MQQQNKLHFWFHQNPGLRLMPTLSFTYKATRNVITTYLFLLHVFLEQKQSKDSKTSRTKPIKKQ